MYTLGRKLPHRAAGHRRESKEEVKTLRSKHQLAHTLCRQQEYAKAEELFQQVVQGREKVLGEEHVDTLDSICLLAVTLYRQQKYDKAEELFQQVVQRREKAPEKEHVDTLLSIHWLALTLYRQQEYAKAEKLFQQVVQGREKVLGKKHVDTLKSIYWLADTLYRQQEYAKAERLFQQVVQGQEKVLGKKHVDTLNSIYWLALTLYRQQEYAKAEKLFQQAVQGREKVLGKEHVDTLDSIHWLADTLYRQQECVKAEELFQQAVQGREKVLGKEHVDTLDSIHWLADTLYRQQKYAKAEELFQQMVQGQEKVLGKEHDNTLLSIHWLAATLYRQQEYAKAEKLFQQAVQGREKVLGKEHVHTLRSIHWLALTLYRQEEHAKAEDLFQQAIQGREKVLGKEHVDTLDSKRLLEELLLTIHSPTFTDDTRKTLTTRLCEYFPKGKESRAPYSDSEIYEISSLLKHSNPRWSKVPRTYIILRTIGRLDLLDAFVDLGFSDYWFPVTERRLPDSLSPSVRSAFAGAQSLILTKSMDLERGERGQHCYFKRGEPLPFEAQGVLGTGGFGQVDKVVSMISFREYARKRVLRDMAFGSRRMEDITRFVAEIEMLKRLRHRHVVEFVGSYTDARYMGLIMSPVAEMDLSTYLTHPDASKYAELRTFFGCLARALEFLHQQNIRHKDIKPHNILVNHGNVLITDFGLSFDFTDANGSTTLSRVYARTPRYCAPEVALQEPRNTSSDIWSLGVVFLEMVVVLKGETMEFMEKFFKEHGSRQAYVRTNTAALLELVAELEGVGSLCDNRALGWIQRMLLTEQQLRPTAASLVTSITASDKDRHGSTLFCGICCLLPDDPFFDSVNELEDDSDR
jgi:TolA-binding protein